MQNDDEIDPIPNIQAPGSPPRTRAIIQATSLIAGITLVVKGLGFVEKILLAYFFGAGVEVDAYLVAFTIPFSAYIVLRTVIRPAFLPTFLRTWRDSARDGWRLFSVVGTVLLILLGVVTVAGILLAEPLIALTAPGFGSQQQELAVQLTRLAMLTLLLLGLSTLTTSVLHAQKRFVPPALGDVSYRSGPLILLLLLGGVQGMMLGVILGALAKLVVELLGLGKQLRRIHLSLHLAFAPVQTVGKLAFPLLVAMSLSLFVGPLVENAFATRVGVGGVSALAFARKIAETLANILPYALGIVLLPFSAEMAAGQDSKALANTLTGAVRGLTLFFLPVTVGLMLLREPFVQLLFERGAFDATSTQLTAGPLLFYALALLPFALEAIVIQFFYARQDALTPVIADILSFVLNVVLIPLLMTILGLGGIALAAALSKALKVLALLFIFERRVPAFRLAALGPFVGQMTLASLATAATLGILVLLDQSFVSGGFVRLAAYLVICGVLGGGAFFLVAYVLKVAEVRDLWRRGWAWSHARRSRQ